MVTDLGDTPLDVIVIVAVDPPGVGVGVGVGVGLGELGELSPPHDAAPRPISSAKNRDASAFFIRRTSSRY